MTLPDKDTFAGTYGGTKVNYICDPIDHTTDLGADGWNALTCTVAMGSRMFPRAEVVIGWPTATAVAVVDHEAVWKRTLPTAPTVVRTGAGVFVVTLPASVNDELGASHAVDVGGCDAHASPAALASWRASRAVSVGDLVEASGRVFRVSTAGTTGGSAPTWDTVVGNTTADGSATWTCAEVYPKFCHAQAERTTANTFTVRTFVAGGTLADVYGSRVSITIGWAH